MKSLERIIWNGKANLHYPESIRTPVLDKNGYFTVILRKHSSVKCYKVHRLVAQHFILNPENKPQVNHVDGNKLNNDVNNLEWVTDQENKPHARRTGLMRPDQYGPNNYMWNRHGKDNPLSKPIYQIYNNQIINEFESLTEASKSTGISAGHISHVCSGKRNHARRIQMEI